MLDVSKENADSNIHSLNIDFKRCCTKPCYFFVTLTGTRGCYNFKCQKVNECLKANKT